MSILDYIIGLFGGEPNEVADQSSSVRWSM